MHLAIVDDNQTELQTLYDTILEYGRIHDAAISCDCYTSCAEFLATCSQISYSFVIFDIYLQDGTGIDMAAAFRQITTHTHHLPDKQPGTPRGCLSCARL